MREKKVSNIHGAGILQWQSYRVLEEHLDQALFDLGISAPEWKTLGVIFDASENGIRSLQIATALRVKPPLVTRIMESLEVKKLITITSVKEDGRVRMVHLTAKGESTFLKASDSVEGAMQKLLRGTPPKDIQIYKSVLLKILENGK